MSYKSLSLATLVFILYLSPFNTIRFFYSNAWTVTFSRFKRIGFVTSFKATARTDTVDGGWEEGERGERSEKERAARTNQRWRKKKGS